jgi:general stress protein YciG
MARGFASLSPERMREIAKLGGRASQAAEGTHRWTPEEAAAAGRKGGSSVSADREHMARIGRAGGKKRVELLRAQQAAEAAAARTGRGDA